MGRGEMKKGGDGRWGDGGKGEFGWIGLDCIELN